MIYEQKARHETDDKGSQNDDQSAAQIGQVFEKRHGSPHGSLLLLVKKYTKPGKNGTMRLKTTGFSQYILPGSGKGQCARGTPPFSLQMV
ncbi:hypothetical protein BBO01nite_44520 [Brevibacillus borstelensis]|nr:hypothetical protein BBO01nite_44520 [Brevibacillus borstelensis]